ncbi:PstS family phosphate ABC transporter substrate-binding protein [Flavobacterium sp. 5]|uniref:PstS family phosphate ABC transporter substrate-binding protein n=1 Tax=Flavobacterium sp. 5 TaxID=2035199 RepID=UPI000C2C7EB2|nr:substrate-binding domain-containing protein [Flavobacterium sp. 5]PKB15893.1 phosphate transport system substrate-binding protein [Flavobacterium sp. 5]
MKRHKKTLLASILLIIIANLAPNKIAAQDLSGNISISGAFALYPITVKWAEEFKKKNPKVKIDIQAGGAGKGITDVLSKVTDIGLVSRDLNDAEYKKKAYAIAVTKDAVIPTISATSPYKAVLYKRGIKKEALNSIFITGKYKTWNSLGFKSTAAIHVYTRSDAAGAAETWAHYFGKKQEDLQGVAVFGDPGLAEAVKRDPTGLGFNNIVYIYDTKTNKPTNGLVPVPIDLNNNGKLDPDENFYNDIDQLIAAIVAGKYPSPPARDLYFVTSGKPSNPIVKAFIKYILTEGQKYVTEAGYIKLSNEKLKKELEKVK